MDSFNQKLAVVTGGGSGMGRELVRQLAAEGCSVATCDVNAQSIAETVSIAVAGAPSGTRVTGHLCDVSDEEQVLRFRDEVVARHDSDHVDLVFNNAGIAGGGSFVTDPRATWERTFGVDWWGVYYCTRAFLSLLIKSDDSILVNTSSINGFWASLGPGIPHTAYSTAKFAVKGFSEALIEDLRLHAPHVKVAVVMPGHVGTDIVANSQRVHDDVDPADLSDEDLEGRRADLERAGVLPEGASTDDIRQLTIDLQLMVSEFGKDFRDNAPLSADGAAEIILEGVRSGKWRILVGDDAKLLDEQVRASPETAYDYTGVGVAVAGSIQPD
jgi:NAD(P)-dependent dehydrogenase (short-subunit alcohol dehydrogenase family)